MARKKEIRPRNTSLSYSAIKTYLECPRRFYYSYCTGLPKRTDYARLCGMAVHTLIKALHKPIAAKSPPRPYFYQSKKALWGAWSSAWDRALRKNSNRLIMPDKDRERYYKKIGGICLMKYWNAFINQPKPLQTEQRYKGEIKGYQFVGIFDQIRPVTKEWISAHRSDLIKNGQLIKGYDPVVIVDFKTNRESYNAAMFKKEPKMIEWVRKQYELHESLQATIYTYLYQLNHSGQMPVGFVWFHLRSGEYFFTYRTREDFGDLFGVIDFVSANRSDELYPKHVDSHCQWCEHLVPCNENSCFIVSYPEEGDGLYPSVELIPTYVSKPTDIQLKLNFSVPRVKKAACRPEIEIAQVTDELTQPITLPQLPWSEDSS